jgi:hypothetical protein
MERCFSGVGLDRSRVGDPAVVFGLFVERGGGGAGISCSGGKWVGLVRVGVEVDSWEL